MTHITFSDVKKIILDIPLDIVGKEKISVNLMKDYFFAINHTVMTSDSNNLNDLNSRNKSNRAYQKIANFSKIHLDKAFIIYGELIPKSDSIVFTSDPIGLYKSIISKEKKIKRYLLDHISIADDKKVIEDILETLEKWDLT
jgi:hypothetical protein